MIGGDLFIAAAISAKRFAKWQVNIDADTLGCIMFTELVCKLLLPSFTVQVIAPERNSRVARIPGHRLVIFSDE
jgi:hypothetical protein